MPCYLDLSQLVLNDAIALTRRSGDRRSQRLCGRAILRRLVLLPRLSTRLQPARSPVATSMLRARSSVRK
jgi:hypothetical protein